MKSRVLDQKLLALHVIAVNANRMRNAVRGEGLHPAPDAAADIDHRAAGMNVEHDRNQRVGGRPMEKR